MTSGAPDVAGFFELVENPLQADTFLQRFEARALDRHAVRHRVRERNSEFDDVADARYVPQRVDERVRAPGSRP